MKYKPGRIGVAVVTLASAGLLTAAIAQGPGNGTWPSGGGNLSNSRHSSNETKLTTANVASLVKKWEYDTKGDVSATPTCDGSTVYVVDWGDTCTPSTRRQGVRSGRGSWSPTPATPDRCRAPARSCTAT